MESDTEEDEAGPDDTAVKRAIHDHWLDLEDSEASKKGRSELIHEIAVKLDVPDIIVEKEIAEWESGRRK